MRVSNVRGTNIVNLNELLTNCGGKGSKKPGPCPTGTKWKAGEKIEVSHFTNDNAHKLAPNAEKVADSWMKSGYDMSLLAISGNRKGAFSTSSMSTLPESKPGAASRMNKLFAEHKIALVAVQGKNGVAVVNADFHKTDDGKKFLGLAKQYLSGKSALRDFTEADHRFMGEHLGYPKASTDSYLKITKSDAAAGVEGAKGTGPQMSDKKRQQMNQEISAKYNLESEKRMDKYYTDPAHFMYKGPGYKARHPDVTSNRSMTLRRLLLACGGK